MPLATDAHTCGHGKLRGTGPALIENVMGETSLTVVSTKMSSLLFDGPPGTQATGTCMDGVQTCRDGVWGCEGGLAR